jgi:hypothetical protein
MTIKEAAKELKKLKNIQGRTGNWDYNPYMHGLYNGIELALATVEGRDPEFKEAPARWLEKNPTVNKPRDPIGHEKDLRV